VSDAKIAKGGGRAMNHKFMIVFMLGAMVLPLAAQQPAKPADWSAWKFLLGDWTAGEGGGQPGQASGGGFSFTFDLQSRVLIRRSFSEFPATKDSPAFRHDDLMIVYQDADGKATRAIYWDNEGHIIQYKVAFSDGGRTVTFLSDEAAPGPRYRFIYRRQKDDSLTLEFDIAPPGREFTKYVEGTARRK
jgi:hypothetical protein